MLILVGMILLASCTKSKGGINFGPEKYYELSYINSGMSSQIIDKDNLDFSESIEFFPDSTFIKKRTYRDSTSIADGHYSSRVLNGDDYLRLYYNKDTYLIQTCGPSLEEYLRIINEKELFNGGYMPCDGPGYFYTRSKR